MKYECQLCERVIRQGQLVIPVNVADGEGDAQIRPETWVHLDCLNGVYSWVWRQRRAPRAKF